MPSRARMDIDTRFDFRTDAHGKDPDSHSPTLRRYHRLLWSKPLPNGAMFELSDSTPGAYLHHRSELGEFSLSSDSIVHSFRSWRSMQSVIEQIPAHELDHFQSIGYTIGGMLVFPANRVDGRQTINGAKGFTRAISDRMDLALECIRRHYLGGDSPLAATLNRYEDFFHLFGDFGGYVSFFLLDDLVSDSLEVQYFLRFDDFRPPSVPQDVTAYQEYRRRCVDFVQARNRRIERFASHQSG
jgi:hypothetical protein